jgi:hypothetical protein
MDNRRKISKYVSRSIKICHIVKDDTELRGLLEEMTTDELSNYWSSYSAGLALSDSNRVPYWKTKEQEKYFIYRTNYYMNFPKEKDGNGKCIINRENLISHIVECILTKTNNSIKRDIDFKNKNLLERFPYYLNVAPFYVIPTSALLVWLSSGIIRSIAEVILFGNLLVSWIAYGIINLIIKKMRKYKMSKIKSTLL